VLVDTEGGNNLLYLPLDQLVQRRQNTALPEPAPTTAAPQTAPSSAARSRERETR
jgi:hypothetical protein